MATTIETRREPERDPSTLTYADLAGEEPIAVFFYQGVWLLRFAGNLTGDQIANVLGRAQGDAVTDQLRQDVLAAAPAMDQIINSTGTLSTALLSDAVRALAKAVYAVGRLVLRRIDN